MSNMGRRGQHGCAFSVRLVNGQRDEYCPECEIDRLRAALATAQAERDKWRGVCVDVGRVIDALGKDIVDLPLLVLDVVKQRDAALTEARRVLRAQDECMVCKAELFRDLTVPHCFDCVVEDEHADEWDAICVAAKAALVSEEPSLHGTGSPSAKRLGSYDELRAENVRLKAQLKIAEGQR